MQPAKTVAIASALVLVNLTLLIVRADAQDDSQLNPVRPNVLQPVIIFAEHVVLMDGQIVTLGDIERNLERLSKNGPLRPIVMQTHGGFSVWEGFQSRTSEWFKKYKFVGMTFGFTSQRASRRYDALNGPEDLEPDPAKRLVGQILLPDGETPARDAEVVLLQPSTDTFRVRLKDGAIRDKHEEIVTRTDSDGRLAIYPKDDQFVLLALHPAGFASATSAQVRGSSAVTLRPWAQVHGRINRTVAMDETVTLRVQLLGLDGWTIHLEEFQHDFRADGAFDKPKVPSGKVSVVMHIPTGEGASFSVNMDTFDIEPGQIREIGKTPSSDTDGSE